MDKITQESIVEALGNMNVMQLVALTKELEAKWGLEALPQVVQQLQVEQQPQKVVEQTEFDVVLMVVPTEKRMPILKALREITGLDLKGTKEMMDAAPKLVRGGASKMDAEYVKGKLVEAGATVEMR